MDSESGWHHPQVLLLRIGVCAAYVLLICYAYVGLLHHGWISSLKRIYAVRRSEGHSFCQRRRQANDGRDEKIEKLLTQARVETTKTAVRYGVHFLFVVFGYKVYKLTMDTSVWADVSPIDLQLSPLLDSRTYQFLLMLVLWANPHLVQPRSIDIGFCLICASQVLRTIFIEPSLEEFSSLFHETALIRLIVGAVVCKPCLTISCNFVATSAIYFTFASRAEMSDAAFDNLFPCQAIGEIALLTCTWLVLEQLAWGLAGSLLDATWPFRNVATARKVLAAFCDAVVILGQDLSIVQPRTVNHLLKTPEDLTGVSFLDLMYDDDKDRFREAIAAMDRETDKENEHAFTMQASLKVGEAGLLDAQLLYCTLLEADQRIVYLVGIREDASQERARSKTGGSPKSELPAISDHEWANNASLPCTAHGMDASSDPPSAASHVSAASVASATSIASSIGTPPITRWEQLPCRRHLAASRARRAAPSQSGGSSILAARLLPQFRATAARAKDASVLEAMSAWNFAPKLGTCCNFHAGVHELKSVLKRMVTRPCQAEWLPLGSWQCGACGILDQVDVPYAPLYCDTCVEAAHNAEMQYEEAAAQQDDGASVLDSTWSPSAPQQHQPEEATPRGETLAPCPEGDVMEVRIDMDCHTDKLFVL